MSVAALRVLVVEDEAIPARAAAVMLGHIGCDVAAIVDTGEEAVETARRGCPGVLRESVWNLLRRRERVSRLPESIAGSQVFACSSGWEDPNQKESGDVHASDKFRSFERSRLDS